MPTRKRLIVNADDFGLSTGVNVGIITAHQEGIVTSASLMVRQPAAEAAAAEAKRHPQLSLGLHLDLGEWTFRNGTWSPVYEVVPLDDAVAVEETIDQQLSRFRGLVGTSPSHLDSHQHVHRREPIRSITIEIAQKLGITLRHCCPAIRYCGAFYGQTDEGRALPEAIGVEQLAGILRALPEGVTELVCHPSADNRLTGMYRTERGLELKALCDPRVLVAIEETNIELCSFHNVVPTFPSSGGIYQ